LREKPTYAINSQSRLPTGRQVDNSVNTLSTIKIKVNHQIKAQELRVIGPAGENFGVISLREALVKAQEMSLDLVEISPNAVPPIGKITDFGKYQYDEKKKQKVAKAKVKTIDTKTLQVKIATDEHDLQLKAKKASEWLAEGHRIKIDLFLTGRAKYMDFKFLNERLDRILKLITEKYKIAEPAKKGLKGLTMMIERA
jgi:translation initiation factor IF-3